MEASVSFHHKSFTQIDIHSKQQQVEVPLINVFFMLVPVLNAPERCCSTSSTSNREGCPNKSLFHKASTIEALIVCLQALGT